MSRHLKLRTFDFSTLRLSAYRGVPIFTGNYRQQCAKRNLPVLNFLRGRFRGFSPRRGDTLHRLRWNLACRRGTLHGGGDQGPLLHAKFHPNRCNDNGVGPQKLKFLLRFDQNVEYKRPAGAYPLCDFHKICRVCTSFQDALGVKIWLDFCSRGYGVMGVLS